MDNKVLELLDKIEAKVEAVECDDYGDPYYKWHATYWLGTDCVWDDWFHEKPDTVQTLLESAKDGSLREILISYIAEEENYNKMLDERSKDDE